jgi:HAD superfamily hydrolase (TIGR01509 family)
METKKTIALETVIFDLDGTLLDGRGDIANAASFTLKTLNLPDKNREEIVGAMGGGPEEFIKKLLDKDDEEMISKAVTIFTGYFIRHPAEEAQLYPNVLEALEYLKRKRKFVVTNRSKNMTEATLRALGIAHYFEDIVGAVNSCRKPSACPLDHLTNAFNIGKEKALLVGDMDVDVQSGKNAGIKTCWVSYGLGKWETVESLQPDYTIDDMIELTKIIE